MDLKQNLSEWIEDRNCTLLGVGPVSKNCLDALIEVSNEHRFPLIAVSSRRQIDASDLGGGYVNNWCTEDYVRYVREHDRGSRVVLERDHGGPWQSDRDIEAGLSLTNAMESAKLSYQADILSGFELIHIDPSIDPVADPSKEEVLERVFELYEFCYSFAERAGKKIYFEIGTEEQSPISSDPEVFEEVLSRVVDFCDDNKFPRPLFVVAQTGTKVLEDRNVGQFDQHIRSNDASAVEHHVRKMVQICTKYGTWLKEHNADYLSTEALNAHSRMGIHASNVAPQFGVIESRSLFQLLRENGLTELADQFVQIAYECGKWKKWLAPDSKLYIFEKAMLAGHYVFANPQFRSVKAQAQKILDRAGISIDDYLKKQIKNSIEHYCRAFKMMEK